MFSKRIRTLVLIAAAGLGLSACTYGDGGYGYTGVSLGYGSGGYYDDYYDGYYGSSYYGGAFGSPYWGWYGDYYYPGTGYYVYDRYRRPHRWNDGQRRYWEQRRHAWRGRDRDRPRNNWGDFRPGDGRPGTRPSRPGGDRPGVRPGRPADGRPDARPGQGGEFRPGVRPGRPGAWVPSSRPDRRDARPGARRPNRSGGGQWRGREGSDATPATRPSRSWGNQGGRSGSRWGGQGGRAGRPRSR